MSNKQEIQPSWYRLFLSIAKACMAVLFLSNLLFAQIIIEDDTEDEQTEESSFRIFDYLSGEIVFSSTTGGVDRNLLVSSLGIEFGFFDDIMKFELQARATETELTITQELTDSGIEAIARGDIDPLPETRMVTITTTADPELEYSLSFSPGSLFTARTGFFTPDLGQFGFLSPVAILLPISTENTGFSFEKGGLFVPQNNVNIQFFPLANLEVSFYSAIGDLSLDTTTEEFINADINQGFSSSNTGEIRELVAPDPNQFFRIVWQPQWGAIGITAFSGVSTFSHITTDRIECWILTSPNSQEGQTKCPTDESEITDDDLISFQRDYAGDGTFAAKEALGFEIAYNFGRRTIIFEAVQSSFRATLGSIDEDYGLFGRERSEIFQQSDIGNHGAAIAYYNWFETGGLMNTESDDLVWSLGYESQSKDGTSHLQLQIIGVEQSASDKSTAPMTWQLLDQEDNPTFSSGSVFPSFLYTNEYSIFGARNVFVAGLGFFASYVGIFANNIVEINDNFSFLIGISGIQNFADLQLADEADEEYYSFSTDFQPGISAGLVLSF